MRTRLRFTTADGKPVTFEACGRKHTMDRVVHGDPEGRAAICRAVLTRRTGIPRSQIVVHYTPLPAPAPDPLAAALLEV